ncbi:MAG: hypothetical protein ACPLXC_00395 [Candidatus Pacearchaeota archaeon]
MFIKKLFENKIDETVHKQFVRFGKGTYGLRAIMNVTRQTDKIKISSTFELANDFVEFIATLAPRFSVSGIVLSKDKMEGFEFRKKAGILACEIQKEMSNIELKELAAKSYATLLDCNMPGVSLKIKKTLPKPSKSGEGKVNDKFCVLELDKKFSSQVHKEFLFDLPQEFKKARIEHTYIIKDIIMPQGEKDFEKIRILAKRKGTIVRKIIVDSKEIVKEKEFVA